MIESNAVIGYLDRLKMITYLVHLVLAHPNLVLGVVALFFYVAAEVIAGDTIGTFALSLGVENYTMMTSYTMICMVGGYILGIALIPKFMR